MKQPLRLDSLRLVKAPLVGAGLGLAILLASSTAAREAAADKGGTEVERVVVVFKTHFDIGYTDLARNVIQRYRTSMIDKALQVCDHTRKLPAEQRFVWTLSGWPMSQILSPDQAPERRERITQAIRDGLLVWHALPATTHTESLGLEDLVRGLGFSSRLSRQFSAPLPRDAKMTDVPSHSWILPTLLHHAGVRFLHLGCNAVSGAPDLPALFWWEGPDGSRLLTMYSAAGYGTGLRPPAGWRHGTWLALIHTGDNHGPPSPSEVEKLLDQARRELPGVEVRLGRLSDFGDAILEENPDLPVVRLDMPDTWIHGIQSMPVETKMARNLRPDIAALEALSTLLSCWGVDVPPVGAAVSAGYEGSLLYGEHTWGASSWNYRPRLYGKAWEAARAEGKYAHAEESWREHGGYIRRARERVAPELRGRLEALAAGVRIEGPRMVVFNPLPWLRDDVVSIPVRAGMPVDWKDARSGEPVPAEVEDGTLRLLATGVPSLGYRSYEPAAARGESAGAPAVKLEGGVLENDFFRVELDAKRGVIVSIADKRSGRELVDAHAGYGFGQYLYERFDDDFHRAYLKAYCKKFPDWAHEFGKVELPPASEVRYRAGSPENFSVSARCGSLSVSATMRSPASDGVPHEVALKVVLFHARPWVDLEWTITDKRPDPWPEAGWLCLPWRVSEPTFRLGRLGAPVDPARDIVRSSNHEIFCIDTGVTVSDPKGSGAGLCPLDSPLVSLGAPGAFRFSREFRPRKPTVLVNLFNNIWGTNFQQWIGGSWSSRVRVWATGGGSVEGELITPSWEARQGCKAAFVNGPAGNLPPSRSGIELSRKGVLVTAFGENPDGEGFLLRLWEQAGADGACEIQLPERWSAGRAQPCDLRGTPYGGSLPVRDARLTVTLGHYAPSSLILTR